MRYEVQGKEFPVVICHLEAGEQMISQKGGMVWMSPNMQMETHGGGLGKMIGRAFTGESMFRNIYTAQGSGYIAFGCSFPGQIIPIDVGATGGMILQKSAFLACQPGVDLQVHFQKKLSAGLFGGEGFLLQKLSGKGMAFVEIDGTLIEHTLGTGEQIVVDTHNLAGFSPTVQMEIKTVPGIKNMLFGGEGLFNTVLTGPGKVWLQTMPLSTVAQAIASLFPPKS